MRDESQKVADHARRNFLRLTAGSIAVAAGVFSGTGRAAGATEKTAPLSAQGPSKRTFGAIDFSVNGWFPGGVGARFADIGHPGLGVCNQTTPWGGLPYSKNRREEVIRGWTPEFMIERMDLANCEKSGLLACWAAVGLGGQDCRVEADEVYQVVNKYPKRFFGIVGVNALPGRWSKYYPRTYIKYAVQQLGFKGVHMYPHWFGVKINDIRMYPIYETCAELDVPFLFQISTGTGMSNSRMCGLPEWIDDLARDFPTLKIVGIHPGSSWEQNFISMLSKDPNVYWGLDAGPPRTWASKGRTTLPDGSLGSIVDLLKQERGPGYREQYQDYQDKVFWGTDFPVQDWVVSLEQFDALDLPESIARKVLRENAIRLFKL